MITSSVMWPLGSSSFSNPIPQLQLLVYDAGRGNVEGHDAEKILGFFPATIPLSEWISLAGLLQGLHMFGCSLEPESDEACEVVETGAGVWAMYEAEPGVFFAFVAPKVWLPRHVSQDNMLAVLKHAHQLITVLVGGVRWMAEQGQPLEEMRSSITSVLKSVGEDLGNSASWISRELRNPFTTLGRPYTMLTPLPITLDVHSLCHRAQTAMHAGQALAEHAVVLFQRAVLWSSLPAKDTTLLTALARSCVFSAVGSSSSSAFLGFSGQWASKKLQKLDSGFVVMREEVDNEAASLPYVYIGSARTNLLAYCKGEVLMLLPVSRATLPAAALSVLQAAVEPLAGQLEAHLTRESHTQGGELGHLPGWRYSVCEASSARASPRSKISAMSHHARALATTMVDSIDRLAVDQGAGQVEVCARSTQGVWAVSAAAEGQRRSLVVRERRAEGSSPAQALDSFSTNVRSLGLL